MRQTALLPRVFHRPGDDGLDADLSAFHQHCRDRLRNFALPSPLATRRRAPRASVSTGMAIVGLAAPALKLRSDDALRGEYRVFARHCFAASIAADRPIRALLNHADADLIATTRDRLELAETEAGLWFRLSLRDAPLDREALALVKSGRCGVSAGWYNKTVENRTMPSGETIAYMIEAELFEISLLDQPAFVETSASLDTTGRSLRTMIRDGALTQRADYDSAAARFSRSLQTLAGSLARASR